MELKNKSNCNCSEKCSCTNDEVTKNTCCEIKEKEICCIKILGAGCKSCKELFKNTQKAINNMGLNIQAEYITDMKEIASYGLMSMPAVVINEKVVSSGEIMKPKDIEKLIKDFL